MPLFSKIKALFVCSLMLEVIMPADQTNLIEKNSAENHLASPGASQDAVTGLVPVSVTPASGMGTTQVFSFVYSDANGYADINYVEMLFQSSLSAPNACYVQYVPSTASISLVPHSGSGLAGSAPVGMAGTLSNSQCTVDTGASSASGSGNNLTITLALAFKGVF